jgi:hypothetical protein
MILSVAKVLTWVLASKPIVVPFKSKSAFNKVSVWSNSFTS